MVDSSENKNLCLQLLKCESEESVIKLLKEKGYWDDPKFWKTYGDGVDSNFGQISGQQTQADLSLVEKIINSVDAVLMNECLIKKVNPEGANAPKSISEALKKWFSVHDGQLRNLTTKQLEDLSEKIHLVASGDKMYPCFSIIDKGEGQTPYNIEKTILSLGKIRKAKIPFVQGKYNMGGAAAMVFAGEDNLQLVISKRSQELQDENDDSFERWGFTIVRRDESVAEMKGIPIYNYLCVDDKLLSFKSDTLPLLPSKEYSKNKPPKNYKQDLESGTLIKLYNYDIGAGLRSAIITDLYFRLSTLLPAMAMPVTLTETRNYRSNSYTRRLTGIITRLESDESIRKNIEDGFPYSSIISFNNERIPLKMYAFKKVKSLSGDTSLLRKNEGIIFHINGQTHHVISNRVFKNKLGFGNIFKSMLVVIDFSETSNELRNRIFMSNRENARKNTNYQKLEEKIISTIKDHDAFEKLQNARRLQDINLKDEKSEPLTDLLQNIMNYDSQLIDLLKGMDIKNMENLIDASISKEKFEGKKFPTYFELMKKFDQEKLKLGHFNKRIRIQYKTDANNDYFDRISEKGKFNLMYKIDNGEFLDVPDFQINLFNGYGNLNINFPDKIIPGDIICFKSEISDNNKINGFIEEFYVKVLDEDQIKPGKKRLNKRKKPSDDKKGNETKKPSEASLPHVNQLYKNEWKAFEDSYDQTITESDAYMVTIAGNQYDHHINMDNKHLKNIKLKKASDESKSKEIDLYYKTGLTLLILGIIQDFKKNQEKDSNVDEIEKSVKRTSRAIAPFFLSYILYLLRIDK